MNSGAKVSIDLLAKLISKAQPPRNAALLVQVCRDLELALGVLERHADAELLERICELREALARLFGRPYTAPCGKRYELAEGTTLVCELDAGHAGSTTLTERKHRSAPDLFGGRKEWW